MKKLLGINRTQLLFLLFVAFTLVMATFFGDSYEKINWMAPHQQKFLWGNLGYLAQGFFLLTSSYLLFYFYKIFRNLNKKS